MLILRYSAYNLKRKFYTKGNVLLEIDKGRASYKLKGHAKAVSFLQSEIVWPM